MHSKEYTIVGQQSPYLYLDCALQRVENLSPIATTLQADIAPFEPAAPEELSFFWRLLLFVKKMCELVGMLLGCCTPSREEKAAIDHGIYTCLLLGEERYRAYPVLSSELLNKLCTVFAKDPAVSAAVVAQLKETEGWLRAMEGVSSVRSDEEESYLKQLAAIADQISSRIKALKEGESCVFPGGTSNSFALYRVTFRSDGYEMQILSQDPQLEHGESIPILEKEKVRIGTTFYGLLQSEVADRDWIQSLLDLQKNRFADGGSLVRLFSAFKYKQVDPSSPRNFGFHSLRTNPSVLFWNFVQDVSGKDSRAASRSKLRLQTDTLFRYVEELAGQKNVPHLAHTYIHEAIKRISQKMHVMLQKEELSREEQQWLSKELGRVEEELKRQKLCQQQDLKIDLPEEIPAIEKPRQPAETALKPPSASEPIGVRPTNRPLTPYHPISASHHKGQYKLPELKKQTLLKTLRKEFQEASELKDPLSIQYRLIDISFALPDFHGNVRGHPDHTLARRLNENEDIWTHLSNQELEQTSALLLEQAKLLKSLAMDNDTFLPDRALAILKLTALIEHLAILNHAVTGLGAGSYHYLQDSNFKWFIEGHSGNRSLYRLYRKEEHAVAKQVESYFSGRYSLKQRGPDEGRRPDKYLHQLPESAQKAHIIETSKLVYDKGVAFGVTAKRIAQWGRPVQNPFFKGAMYGIEVSHGSPDNGYPGDSFGPWWMTQEAMMDDPMRLLKMALGNWVRDANIERYLDKEDKLYKVKNAPLELEMSEVQDLLLSMEDRTVIWNLLGLVEQNPWMLKSSDICTVIELLFLNVKSLKEACDKDLELETFLKTFFDKHITAYVKRQEIGPALFLIQLNQTLRSEMEFKQLPDYSKKVQQWMLESFRPGSETAPYRYPLLESYLLLFENREELNQEEIRDLIVFNSYFETFYGDPSQFNPVFKDRIRRMMRAWAPAMEKALQERTFLQHTLDKVCELREISFPESPWSGEFPQYHSENYQVNLMTGVVSVGNANDKLSQLSSEVLRDPLFKKCFPDFLTLNPKVAAHLNSELSIFAFRDQHEQEVRIEVANSQVSCYRKHPERESFLLAVDQIEKFESVLPSCIADQHLFVAVDDPKEVWSFGHDGKAQFAFYFKEERLRDSYKNVLRLEAVVDKRAPETAVRRRQIATFDLQKQPMFKTLLGLDAAENILLWHSNSVLEEVEFFRYQLKFAWKEGRLHCITPPYQDCLLPLNPSHEQRQGLAAGIVLEKPDQTQLILLPDCEGALKVYKQHPPFPNSFSEFIAKLWKDPESRELAEVDTELFWNQSGRAPARFWVLEKREQLHASPGQKSTLLWFEVLCHAIQATHKADCNPFTIAKRALSELSTMIAESLSDKEIEKMVKTLFDMAEGSGKEGLALALKGLLVLREKCSSRMTNAIEEKIAKVGTYFYSTGKHIDIGAALNQNQMAVLIGCLRKHASHFYNQFGPLLQGDAQVSIAGRCSPLFEGSQRVPGRILQHAQFIQNLLKQPVKEQNDLFLTRDSKKIISSFGYLYTLIQKGEKSEQFEKMRLTIQALPSSVLEEDPVIQFLEMLFELRIEHPDFKLPEIPANSATEEWLRDIINRAERVNGKREAKPEMSVPKINHSYVAPRKTSLEDLSIEELEKMLESMPAKRAATALSALQPEDCLFKETELESHFEKSFTTAWNGIGPIAQKNEKDEPVVDFFKADLRAEMEAYEKSLPAEGKMLHKIKSDQVDAVHQLLISKRDAFKSQAETQRNKVMEKFSVQASELAASELRAGYRRALSWDEIFVACLEENLPELLVQARQQDVDVADLKKAMTLYLELETKHRYANFCLNSLEGMKKEGTILSASSGEKIFEMLLRCRSYDSKTHLPMLVVEYVLGFLCTEKQLEIISGFVTEPSSVYRAITGVGKTSAILLLAALMKADGQNLVTVKFLDSLLPENLAHFQRVCAILKRPIYHLNFSMSTPLIHRHTVEGKQIEESAFKRMYHEMLRTAAGKGCMIVGRRSEALLVAKLISYSYKMVNLPENQQPPQKDLDHLYWLAKVVDLLDERQSRIYDEHDKLLHPKDEIHVRLDKGKAVPQFLWKTSLEIFDLLVQEKELRLRDNVQDELTEKERRTILDNVGAKIAARWATQFPDLKKLEEGIVAYLQGKSEAVLSDLEEKCTLQMCDAISLTKDMLLTFLPITLSKSRNKKYIRSEDGVNVIGCRAVDKPREGSDFDEIRERLGYYLQYYYQDGVSLSYFTKWTARLTRDGFEEMEKKGLVNLSKTRADALFKDYFPDESLDGLLQNDILRLHREVKEKPALIRKFLEVLLPEQKISGTKITIDAHNDVSIAHEAGGTSATLGCVDGLHRQFKVQEDSKQYVRAKMLSRLCHRLKTKELLTYDPANPSKIIPSLLKKDPTLRVVIDGAGALWGVNPKTTAEQLKEAGLEAVGYFDMKDRYQIEGAPEASMQQRGQVYSHSQARGANVELAASLNSVLSVNGRSPLEEVMQNEGRLRQDQQPMRIAVPETSKMKKPEDVLDESLVTGGTEYGDQVFHSKKQEQRDILWKRMVRSLTKLFVEKKFKEGFELFKRYDLAQILVTERQQDWEEPGSYYKQHKHIEKKDADSVKVLECRQKDYKELAEKLGLKESVLDLDKLKYAPFASKMARGVYSHGSITHGTEVEVEEELSTEAEEEVSITTEAELEQVTDKQEEVPYYLRWQTGETGILRWHSSKERLHPAYDPDLRYSENFLPTRRNSWAAPIYRRSPHDLKQNRLHYLSVYISKDSWVKGKKHDWRQERVIEDVSIASIDQMDAHEQMSPYQHREFEILYDTHLRRFVMDRYNKFTYFEFTSQAQKKLTRLIAQARFEDGQYDTYDEAETEALRTWLKEQPDPSILEKYFVDEVLKNRSHDRERYRHSPLKELFDSLK